MKNDLNNFEFFCLEERNKEKSKKKYKKFWGGISGSLIKDIFFAAENLNQNLGNWFGVKVVEEITENLGMRFNVLGELGENKDGKAKSYQVSFFGLKSRKNCFKVIASDRI